MIQVKDLVPSIRGELQIEIYRAGRLVERIAEHNLVTNTGRARLARLASGLSNSAIMYIGFGTGTAVPKITDTALTDQVLYQVKGAQVSGADAIFDWELLESDAVGMDITEFGLFSSDQKLMTHVQRGKVIGKDSDMSLVGKYILHF